MWHIRESSQDASHIIAWEEFALMTFPTMYMIYGLQIETGKILHLISIDHWWTKIWPLPSHEPTFCDSHRANFYNFFPCRHRYWTMKNENSVLTTPIQVCAWNSWTLQCRTILNLLMIARVLLNVFICAIRMFIPVIFLLLTRCTESLLLAFKPLCCFLFNPTFSEYFSFW